MGDNRKKSLFEATPEEIIASRRRSAFFSPGFKMLTDDELEARGVHIEVIDDTRSHRDYIADELRSRGYSGYYRKDFDGVVVRIIPLDKYGRREDV